MIVQGILSGNLNGLVSRLGAWRQVFCVVDRKVWAVNGQVALLLTRLVENGVPVFALDVSERNKSMETVVEIDSWLLEQGADRDALVLCIGGGILTDMAGFAAAIYKRGVDFAFVPTTMLAQVDAAIGGKTGANFRELKNMLGVFCQPVFTYLSTETLYSLSPRDFRSGIAELLKTFIIGDVDNYRRAVSLFGEVNGRIAGGETLEAVLYEKNAELSALTGAAAKMKQGIVGRDEFERGERRNLNLGHTFAHAIETLAMRDAADITHGEAVSMGMVMAAGLAEQISGEGYRAVFAGSGEEEEFVCENGLAGRLRADFNMCGLQTECPYVLSEMLEIMRYDKKAEGREVRFVLPSRIGRVLTVLLNTDELMDFPACRVCRK